MTHIASVTLGVSDPAAANRFYATAFGLDGRIHARASEAPTAGFRGFTLSLVVSQPADVNALVDAAVAAGAATLKPAAKSLWGYGGVVRAPDGTIWQVASSSKKDTGPATRGIDEIVLLLGVADMAGSKRFYVGRGLTVAKSYGSRYVEFATGPGSVKLALYKHRALAKVAGVAPDGTGSHRLTVDGDTEPFTDPDGFAWATTSRTASPGTAGLTRSE
ncbi:glyoxalase [Streptomyces hainanensis]|uniref:Glyoxalase n=1 Tax=Streptomyces hainanensis TaxID=402648 RepID=A0A4R4TNQ7_9ACTN|nr:glyoxalase [Streptomyces hainanensis]TDC79717.1 glyoxalase [Streptomyces hainanensis]